MGRTKLQGLATPGTGLWLSYSNNSLRLVSADPGTPSAQSYRSQPSESWVSQQHWGPDPVNDAHPCCWRPALTLSSNLGPRMIYCCWFWQGKYMVSLPCPSTHPWTSSCIQSCTQSFFLLVPTMLLDELIVISVKKMEKKKKKERTQMAETHYCKSRWMQEHPWLDRLYVKLALQVKKRTKNKKVSNNWTQNGEKKKQNQRKLGEPTPATSSGVRACRWIMEL